jgi:hypothetical protein
MILLYSGRELCAGVQLFEGYCYRDFSRRWPNSWTRGTDIRERADSQLLTFREERVAERADRFSIPLYIPEKDLCSLRAV